MELPDLQRIPEAVRDALRSVLGASAVDQVVGHLRDIGRRVQQLMPVAGRVEDLETGHGTLERQLIELRADLADLATRVSKLEHHDGTQARELSELRVRLHGTTARAVRLEEEAGRHIRELGELRQRLDHGDDRGTGPSLADIQRHLAENDRRLAVALAEVERQVAAARRVTEAVRAETPAIGQS